jgi:Ca2+-binding RTX toxin-like protein
VRSFSVNPAGAPRFDVFYGDIEVNQSTGNLYVVGSPQNIIRELTPRGDFVRDIDLSSFNIVGGISGIAFDDTKGEAYISTILGRVYHLGGFPIIPTVNLSLGASRVTEDGPINLVYTFTRIGPTTTPLTINYTIAGTATNGTDYTRITNSIVIPAGAASATLVVDPIADTVVEPDETVVITLAANPAYKIGTDLPRTGTIVNDDTVTTLPSITLTLAPTAVAEDGAANLTYTFKRSGAPLTSPLTVNYSIGGTATNGTDYASIASSITFAAGKDTATLVVDPTPDTTVEPNETVNITLTPNPAYTNATSGAVVGTINNDDQAPALPSITLTLAPTAVAEDGAANLTYTFKRSGAPLTSPLTVNYSIGGTATNGTDYASIASSITFAAGKDTATLVVDPTPDTTVEPNETVNITLTPNPAYTNATSGAVVGTINNDDQAPAPANVSVSLNLGGISEDAPRDFIYTFTRTVATTNPLTVNFNVGGTATLTSDYTVSGATSFTATTGSVTFATGATTATVTLNPGADTVIEADETINLTLATGTGYTIATPSTLTATIINDDGTRRQRGTNLDDVIVGTSRSDIISGGLGADILTGGANGDTFLFRNTLEGIDTITDFVPGTDYISVSALGFGGGLTAGDIISAAQFLIGTAATTASHRFIYNSTSGTLFFDRDGAGGVGAVQFATLSAGLALTHEDIFVS